MYISTIPLGGTLVVRYSTPGVYYLVRFQDCRTFGNTCRFYTLAIKGLELQEDSCHTVEDIQVDKICFRIQVASGVFKPTCRQRSPSVRLTDTQHLLRRQKRADWGYRSTGKIGKKFRKFLQDSRLGFGELLQTDRKFDSTQEDTQPVTTDLTK